MATAPNGSTQKDHRALALSREFTHDNVQKQRKFQERPPPELFLSFFTSEDDRKTVTPANLGGSFTPQNDSSSGLHVSGWSAKKEAAESSSSSCSTATCDSRETRRDTPIHERSANLPSPVVTDSSSSLSLPSWPLQGAHPGGLESAPSQVTPTGGLVLPQPLATQKQDPYNHADGNRRQPPLPQQWSQSVPSTSSSNTTPRAHPPTYGCEAVLADKDSCKALGPFLCACMRKGFPLQQGLLVKYLLGQVADIQNKMLSLRDVNEASEILKDRQLLEIYCDEICTPTSSPPEETKASTPRPSSGGREPSSSSSSSTPLSDKWSRVFNSLGELNALVLEVATSTSSPGDAMTTDLNPPNCYLHALTWLLTSLIKTIAASPQQQSLDDAVQQAMSRVERPPSRGDSVSDPVVPVVPVAPTGPMHNDNHRLTNNAAGGGGGGRELTISSSSSSSSLPVRCSRCGGLGHSSSECSTDLHRPTLTCQRCFGRGHVDVMCPSRPWQPSKPSAQGKSKKRKSKQANKQQQTNKQNGKKRKKFANLPPPTTSKTVDLSISKKLEK